MPVETDWPLKTAFWHAETVAGQGAHYVASVEPGADAPNEKVHTMKTLLLAATLLAALSTAGCQTTKYEWSTDDGRSVSSIQFERERAACNALAMASVPVPGPAPILNYGDPNAQISANLTQMSANIQAGAAMGAIGENCLRAKGFMLHKVPNTEGTQQ